MFDNQHRSFIAINDDKEICFIPKMANRHGLITGATGTGKTVTLQNLAETFSKMGVPVFAADIKGDLSGVAKSGGNKESVVKRVESYHLNDKGFEFLFQNKPRCISTDCKAQSISQTIHRHIKIEIRK